VVLASFLLLAACGGNDESGDADSAALAGNSAGTSDTIAHLTTIEGLDAPESARYDAAQDVWFVSNVNGAPSAIDNNGYISRVTPDGAIDSAKFIAGGRSGATLNAPKGIFIRNDTLWVADIGSLRAFSTRTGESFGSVNLGKLGATMLNDIAAGGDGALYITDTGVLFGVEGAEPKVGKIFRVAGADASVALSADALHGPNGIAWDAGQNRLLIGSYTGDSVLAWKPGDSAATAIAGGPGQYDGVRVLADGRILVTSWTDSSVNVVEDGGLRRIVGGVPGPAAIGIDTKRSRLAVPLLGNNRVEMYSLPQH
jgi:sugar lactone lactonase YvrE